MLEDNPLAVGALALALGTAIGLAVPETQREHRLMGDMRDNLLDQASSKASETFQKVQQVADAAVSTAVREGSQAVQEVKQTAKEEVQKQGLVGSNDQQGQGQQGQGQQGQAQRSMGQSQPMGQGQTPTRTGGQPVSTGENKPVSPPTGQGGASSMPTGPTKKDMSGGEDRLRPGQTGPQTGGQNKP